MKLATTLLAGTILAASNAALAHAQAAQPAAEAAAPAPGEIIVTARQREESLKNVPIAVTAVTGAEIQKQQIYQVREVASLSPGVNINSDSAGRAFVSMRGIGTTLIDSVQPGVGIFIDGVYQPNTSYLNTPLVDVARVEVLRGPQGTLFGNNTLGGAINVITKQPTNDWEGRVDGAYAGPDDFESVSGSISGPIVKDVLQFRVGAAYHNQDNFQKNSLIGGYRNPLSQNTVNGEIRYVPTSWATITLTGDFDRVFGGSVPYGWSNGPTDYTLNIATNVPSLVTIDYYGANLKGVFDAAAIKTKITIVGAYDGSDAHQPQADADFGPIDFLRATSTRALRTVTGEVRFDTAWSDSISTLIGVFGDSATTHSTGTTTIVPLGLTIPAEVDGLNETQAVFGTVFWKLGDGWDLAAGVRYDHQRLNASAASTAGIYEANQLDPRITLTKRWSPDVMTYASVARGSRGGGQNDPGAPNLIYRGDEVWTYEVGSKFTALDRRLTADVDVFYNDYDHFIGPNALAPSTTGAGFVAVDLNAGHVDSYGFEGEANFQATRNWRLYGNLTLLHARITSQDEFVAVTGYSLPGNHIPFVPDWNFLAGQTYTMPLGDDEIAFDANVVAKGARHGDSLDQTVDPVMKAYYLVNGSIAWRHKGLELAVFGTNIFDDKYLEAYLDKSLLGRAGVPSILVHSLALQGQRARAGIRASYKF